nr:MAG TPA: Ftsk gamma domain [Caudoviricetes sp.]
MKGLKRTTQREFFTTIVEGATVTAEMEAFASHALANIDKANESRRERQSKKAQENEPLLAQIETDILTVEPITASNVAAILGTSTQKATALLRALVAAGRAQVQDVKVTGKGTQKGYFKAEA